MECLEVQRKISAYIDGEVESGLADRIAGHLKQCLACRKELEELHSVDALVVSLPCLTVSLDLSEKVLTRLDHAKAARRLGPGFPEWLWPAVKKYLERFFEVLEPAEVPSTHSLDEFNDIPESFIGYVYFKILDEPR